MGAGRAIGKAGFLFLRRILALIREQINQRWQVTRSVQDGNYLYTLLCFPIEDQVIMKAPRDGGDP